MDVRMPDGTVVTGVPDDITQTQLLERYNRYSAASPATAQPESEGILGGLMKNAAKVQASKDAVFGQANQTAAKPAAPFEQPAVDAIGMAEQPFEQPQGLAAIAPKKPSEFAPGQEFSKGVAGAFNVALPSMWEQAGVMKDVGALGTVQKRLELFGKIDQGDITDFDQLRGLDLTTSQARSYLGATPEMREKMKERLTGEVSKRTDFVKASIDTLAQYQKEMEQYKGRTQDLTDVEGVKDFANWLSYNVGSGAVQMAPIMIAAATTGPMGVAALGTGMGVSEAVGNRLDALAPKLKGLNDEQKAQEVIDYVTKTGDTSLAVGVISGAFDSVLGPAAQLAKRGLSQVVKGETRKEALKHGIKELPKQMGEEFITGGAQEATQIAGAVREGETPEFWTKENLKKILNSAAAEAAGSIGGGGISTAARVYGANKAESEKEKALADAFQVPEEERKPYVQEPQYDAENLARSKGFLSNEAPSTDLLKETEPTKAAEPIKVPKSESQDLDAMLAELEAQLEGKPVPAKAEEPVAEESSVAEPVSEEPAVKESLTPEDNFNTVKVEAPSTKLVEEAISEEPKFDSTEWEKQPIKINEKTGKPVLGPGQDRFKKVDEDGTTHSVRTKDGVVVQSNTRSPIVTLTNSVLTDEGESVSGRIEVDNRTGNLVFIGEGDRGAVFKMSPRAKQRYQEGVPFNKIAEEEFSDAGGIRPDGTKTPHTTTSVMEMPTTAIKPIFNPVKEEPKAEQPTEIQEYDTPALHLQQYEALGDTLEQLVYGEMESYGRAALKKRSLTGGYADRKDNWTKAMEAGDQAFATNDFSAFEPYATLFPKTAKKLRAHLATETKAAPVVEEAKKEEPKAAKTEAEYQQDIRNGMSSINAVREKRITQEQYEEYQTLAEVARKELDKLQSKQAADLSPAQQEAIQIAERMEALGEKSFTAGVRNAARNPSVERNLPFYREKLADLESKRGAAEQAFSETHSLKDLMRIESDKGLEKLEQYQKTAAPATRAAVERAGEVVQQVKDAINSAGYAVNDVGASSPYELQKLKNLHSQLEASITQVLTQHNKLATGHKVSSQEALDKRVNILKTDINKSSQELRRYAQLSPEIREQEEAITGAKRAADKTSRESGSLWTSLVGKLDQSEVRDIFSANPTFGQKRLQIKGGKKVTGAQVSDLVSDGDLDRFLPPDMRHNSPSFDERESTELVKQKIREQDYLPFETKIEIEQIFGSVQEAEKLVDEFLTIEEQNLELQTAADEQRESEINAQEVEPGVESRAAEPNERAPLELTAPTADELKSKQDEIDRLTKENERLAKQAEAKAKADAERDEFVLTGSDRAADVAAAQGQKDIFGAMEEEAPAVPLVKLQKVAESLLDSPRTKETVDEVEYEGKTYESRTRSYDGRLFGSELNLLRDAIGNANSVTLVNEPERVLTLQLTGKQVGQGRDMLVTETVYTPKEEAATGELVTFTHKTDTEPGKGQVSGYYPGTYSYETGADVAIPAKGGKNEFVGELKESDIYTLKDADQLKREASNAGFEYRQASGNSEIRYLQSLGYKAMRRGPEIIVFNAKDANFKKPEVASEVVPAAEKPAAPRLTREPVTIEGETKLVGEKIQHSVVADQLKKLSDAQIKTLEALYGFKRNSEEFLDAARQDVITFVTKGAKYVNGKIRAIIKALANGVLSVAVVFNPQFISNPYPIAIPQYTTKVEQVLQNVPEQAQKEMSDSAKRAYSVIYPAIKADLEKNNKFFVVADKPSARIFVFNPDGSLLVNKKVLFALQYGDFYKGNNDVIANRITPAGMFDLGLRDAKRSAGEAVTAGEYDFGKVFVLDKAGMGKEGPYSMTTMHSVWTHEKDAKQRLAALQKPGAEDSRYSFGCINVDKATYGDLVTNHLSQMDGAKLFIVPENGTDVMSFVNGEATYKTDIIRKRVEPVTKETKVEVERAAPTAETERTVVGKEEEGPIYNDIFSRPISSEEKKRSPSFKRRMDKLNRDRLKGKISDEQFVNEADWALKQAENARQEKPVAERVRGADFIRQKLLEAKRKGNLSEEAVDLAEWFIRNNEQLVEDLGISVRSPSASGVGGQYSTLSKIIILMKDAGSNLTVVHEILHHLERMMPPKVQQAIRKAWADQLISAQKKAKTPAEQLYFKMLIDAHYGDNNFNFVDVPNGPMSEVFMKAMAEVRFENPSSTSSLKIAETLLKMGAVPYEQYQFFNPSEFWAVNGSDVVQGRFNAVQGGVLARLKNWLKELGQKIKGLFGLDSQAAVIKALDSLSKGDGQFVTKDMLGEGEYKNVRRNYEGNEAPAASWESPEESKMDNFIYKLQDKLIDTKRVIESIKKTSGEIADNWDVYLKEELFHGRTAKRTQDFLNREMLPILEEMKDKGVTLAQFEEYLHMRHAEERNALVAKRNPKLQDQGSGVKTADAVKYLAELSPDQAKTFESLAGKFDKIIDNTQKLLVSSGLETQDTIDSWNGAYEHYVPLMRDDLDFKHHGKGLGGGYSTRGGSSKSAVGSTKKVIDIFANVALQRERAITRSEKARVGRALYGLAIKNPNPGFWLPINPDAIKNKEKLIQELEALGMPPEDAENIIQEPKVPAIDKKTGLVKYQVNPLMRSSDNVFPVRINGEDRFIFFNTSDERAIRMVESLKNLDAEQLGGVLGAVGTVTRWIASVNTQFNPVFGLWNFARDVQGAAFNLTTTEIAGNEKKVLDGVLPALKGIYVDLRANRKKSAGDSEWAKLFEQYELAGGQTGYRDQFNQSEKRANIVKREMDRLNHGNVRKVAEAVFNWLSDYNDAMENAVRLSAFKVALDQGLTEERAASIAKNLTVNFNRKGASSPTLQALYAFFNAAVQGTARLVQTLRGPAGKKIMVGGLAIGVAQAIALAMAGFDDDDPPEFMKNKNLILPVPGGNYLIVPMPLGFNVFPGVGRLTTEYVLGQAGLITGAKGASDKLISVASLVLDAFNPLGSGSLLQMAVPTVADPVFAVYGSNRDAFGRPIAKEDRATAPTPGYTRSRENATWFSKNLAEFLNYVSSPIGTKYTKGLISPTADQIDYLIGQYTGGVGREVMKAGQYAAAVVKGETGDVPSYRVPIVGKLYGETESPAAVSAKFYENVTKLAEHENEIKMRIKNKDNVSEYRAEHPEVRFINRVNNLENQVTALNKQKKALQERDAPEERIKKLDERKTKMMKDFNDQIKRLERQ